MAEPDERPLDGLVRLPQLETARCLLRIPAPDDAPLLVRFLLENRARLAPWEPAREAHYYTEATVRRQLVANRAAADDGSALHFVAFDKQHGHVVATCAFTNILRGVFQACHMGYAVDHGAEGSGVMFEVAQAGIAHMFGQAGLHRVMAGHAPHNVRSERLLRRLGFEREGYARSCLLIDGSWQDSVLNALVNPLE